MMDTDRLTRERFEIWRARFEQDHATPVLVLGVGQEHRAGDLFLLVPEGVTHHELIGFLDFALKSVVLGGPIPKHDGETKIYQR